MIDWTKLTRDPVDTGVRKQLKEWLLARRHDLPSNDYDAFLIDQVRGKSVLDIGICEHTAERINSPNWKHRLIRESALKCVGVDIIEDLVKDLVAKGFDVVCQDATSDAFLGETFEVVHIGDVIEHVTDPQRLLAFAARHLAPGGKILVRTPNPHNFDYQRHARRDGISVENMEHISLLFLFMRSNSRVAPASPSPDTGRWCQAGLAWPASNEPSATPLACNFATSSTKYSVNRIPTQRSSCMPLPRLIDKHVS